MPPLDVLPDLEDRLRRAMLAGDVAALDALISDRLVFTTQTGAVVGKAEDLEAHRSGTLKLTRMDPSERHVVDAGGAAVVSVRMAVAGTVGGEAFAGDMRYTRVWAEEDGRRRIVAGHLGPVLPA